MTFSITCLLGPLTLIAGQATINPFPRPVRAEPVREWKFERDVEGWRAQNDCRISHAAGTLVIDSTGDDPFLHRRLDWPGGRMLLRITLRGRGGGRGTVYWATERSPRGEDKTSHFDIVHDGRWREYETRFFVDGRLVDLRLDPGTAPGRIEVRSIELVREHPHPLTIGQPTQDRRGARFPVTNEGEADRTFSVEGREYRVPAGGTIEVEVTRQADAPLQGVSLRIRCEDFPPLSRFAFLYDPDVETDWITRPMPGGTLRVAPDGSLASIERAGSTVAIVGPLVHRGGVVPKLELIDQGDELKFAAEGVSLGIAVRGDEVGISIDASHQCTGPTVRVLGKLNQGLLAGVEYLGRGEASSSKLDVETDEHVRFQPDPMSVTMPLMSVVSDLATVDLSWDDMTVQPVYASPNFFDGQADHLMALRGEKFECAIRVNGQPLEESILWAVRRRGLPPLPAAPRDREQQWQLCLQALNGPLKGDGGWGHAAEPRWSRQPYADFASTVWRLTGRAPELPRLARHGSHVSNDSIYFVTGRAEQWLREQRQSVAAIMERQQGDGSFRYSGRFRRGHFEDTASGFCAQPVATLLEHACLTGDRRALEAGIRGLEYMKRFRTPRGAQTWEVPLHTPDLLASAYLVWAYAGGYELTGDESHLREARRWALSGLPFVYQWSDRPIMAYATTPVYGATNWEAPLWIGLPVQWVGGVYAYALTKLAPHDRTLDWNRLAEGILLAAEQMQYPDGAKAGLFPDAFRLRAQERLPADINPCALVSLRLAVEGKVDSLAVAAAEGRRVAAPYPVRIENGRAIIEGEAGRKYQVLVDGQVVEVESRGEDRIELSAERR